MVALIVDDVLIEFDRACAALASEKTQVLYFTHHKHIVELAESSIIRNRLSVHESVGHI